MANTQVSISKNGKTTLATAGKYCDRNIDVNVAVASTADGMPDYVKTEADSLVAKVVSAQGSRVFTLAAITDLHYGNGSYTDGILHASQALAYINKQITLDAFAVLGDYTDGYPIDNVDNAFGDCRKVNSLLAQMEAIPNLRIQGNHDFYNGYAQFVHYHIQAYSEGVTWGDKIGGYFYRDFADKKLRIICVNTTETDNSKIFVSDAQYNWFIGALDLSAKSDASDWQILILSHHPLDWYADTYVFCYILEAYKSGSSWSSGNISCNFAGKNAGTLIGNIHGHIHNLLIGYINKGNVVTSNHTKVLRVCTPEACINRANQYDGAWKEATTYNKTQNSAKDTSFVVYCIDLNAQSIKACCYGAGYDREISYAPIAPTVYNITNSLTNCTASGASTIVEEGTASVTIVANSGYELPDTITVSGASYTWDKSTGMVVLSNPTGNVTVTVIAVEAKVEIINLLDAAGYKNNTRLSTSNGAEKTQSGHVATGYIYVGDVVRGDVIRTKGIDFTYGTYPNQGVVASYDTNKTLIGVGYVNTPRIRQFQYTMDASGNLTLTCDLNKGSDDYSEYLRFSGMCADGANAIITKNQPIE